MIISTLIQSIKPTLTRCFIQFQASLYEFAEAGSPVLQVTATDVECANSSCIIYGLVPADNDHNNNSLFVIDSRTGSLRFLYFLIFTRWQF